MPKTDLPKISSLLIIGDSLTDRGRMEVKKLLKFIPMKYLSGLAGTSPDGRFTNGYNWADILSYALIDDHKLSVIKKWAHRSDDIAHTDILKESTWQNDAPVDSNWANSTVKKSARYYPNSYTDDDLYATKRKHGQFSKLFYNNKSPSSVNAEISDAILHHDKKIKPIIDTKVSLDHDELILYKKNQFVRSIAEGGATSSNFFLKWSWSPKHFFSRLVLNNLKSFRQMIFKEDESVDNALDKNKDTLVIEWTGANDVATVNPRPTPTMAKRAVTARIENVKKMLEKGYKHFVLFNIPDLSLTPRYQVKQRKHINYAYLTSKVFNETLQAEMDKLQTEHPDCMFDVFDINALFSDMYHHPEEYGFDKDKLQTPFLDVKDQPIDETGNSPAKGYVFWDDVHSTADAQAQKALALIEFLSKKYHIQPDLIKKAPFPEGFAPVVKPDTISAKEKALKNDFVRAYTQKLDKDYHWGIELFGFMRRSKLPYLRTARLEDIAQHAFLHKKSRTNKIIKKLGWLDEKGDMRGDIQAELAHSYKGMR